MFKLLRKYEKGNFCVREIRVQKKGKIDIRYWDIWRKIIQKCNMFHLKKFQIDYFKFWLNLLKIEMFADNNLIFL